MWSADRIQGSSYLPFFRYFVRHDGSIVGTFSLLPLVAIACSLVLLIVGCIIVTCWRQISYITMSLRCRRRSGRGNEASFDLQPRISGLRWT